MTLFRIGRLLDVRDRELKTDMALEVDDDGRIVEVAPWNSATSREFTDLGDYLVAPGLIDLHTHLIGALENGRYDAFLQRSAGWALMEGVKNAATTLRAGFTTVRDMGTFRAFLDCDLRDAIESGIVPGPRMFTAGGYLTSSSGGGEITDLAHDIHLPEVFRAGVADSVDEVRKVVRQFIHGGSDFIKVIATGAVLAEGTTPGAPEFTEEQLRAAVEEAALYGKRVAAHAHGTLGALQAVRAGVRTLDHGSFIDGDEIFDELLARDTYYVPTTQCIRHILNQTDAYSEQARKKTSGALDIAMAAMRTAVERGVKLAYGTDAILFPHGENAQQLMDFTEAGLSPTEAVLTATINAADALENDSVGVLEAGRFGDFIAFKGSKAITDVGMFQHVDSVFKGGVAVD